MMCAKNNILIVGDIMLDITWEVSRPQLSITTSQFHGGVIPEVLNKPGYHTEMLGGAGTVARRILANKDFQGKIYLAGACSENTANALNNNPHNMIPELNISYLEKRLCFIHIAKTEFDTIKWRLYSHGEKGNVLKHRFDRDLRNNDVIIRNNKQWPNVDEISVVVVMDFNKGLFGSDDNIAELSASLKIFKPNHFLLRAKRELSHRIFNLPWSIYLPNREDFARCLGDNIYTYRAIRLFEQNKKMAINPLLIDQIHKFIKKGNRQLIVKLDKEGIIFYGKDYMVNDKNICVIAINEKSQGNWAGVSAGDVFISDLAVELNNNNFITNTEKILDKSVKSATAYCRTAENIVDDKRNYLGRCFDKNDAIEINKVETSADQFKLLDFRQINQSSSALEVINLFKNNKTKREINIFDAEWYLDGYHTLDKNYGEKIINLKIAIENYLLRKELQNRPFATAVCGKPGSGKSSLVKCFACSLNLKYIESSVGQWATLDELYLLCEQIRSIHITENKIPLVFLDEVDCKVEGEHIYGKLLAPTWDGVYIYRGFKREIGPTIFILSGSSGAWENGSVRKKDNDVENKISDIFSRLRISPILIPPIYSSEKHKIIIDAIYVIAYHVIKIFPRAKEIDLAIFEILANQQPIYDRRSLVQAIQSLPLYLDDLRVSLRLKDLNSNIMKVHFPAFRNKRINAGKIYITINSY